MKNKLILSVMAAALSLSVVLPALAEGPGSVFGSVSAFTVDVPEGVIVDSLYNAPHAASKALAVAFGDEHGLLQNAVGVTIGVPVGVVWGIPYGALHGAKHGIGAGWDKPFSTDSYIVSDEK
jgi:hypothetical protein